MNNEQETIVLGIVGIKNMGEYDAETNYEKLNVVTYQGSSYCALKNTVGNIPTNSEYWQLYAEKGGVGPQGPKPIKGTDYFTEEDILEIENDLQPVIVSNVQSEVTTQVGNISNGTPLKANSISDMTDTTRLYVNTSNGYVYYYNGTDWVQGWLYQATAIGENEVKYENLSTNLQNIFSTDLSNVTVTSGHYIRYDGRYSDSSSYSVTDSISLKKGETIYLKCQATTSQSVISELVTTTYYPLVIGTSTPGTSVEDEYFYTAKKDMNVVLTFKHTANYQYYKLVNSNVLINLENIKDYEPPYIIDDGHYINNNGIYAAGSAYHLSSPITLKIGEKITLIGIAADVVSSIAQKNSDGTYTSLVQGLSTTEVKTYEYTNNGESNIEVVISYWKVYPKLILKTLTENIFTDIYSKINEENVVTDSKNNYLMAFNNITAIGDSLTFSQVYTGVNTHRQSYNPYPKVLSRLIGSQYQILATSGDTPVSWWSTFNSQLTNNSKDNLFIIYLGTNGGLTDTLSTDAPVNTDYSTWADTNTGCYAKIVAKCQSLGGKVLLIKPWKVSYPASLDTTNDVIDQIVERFNCVALDPIKLENINYHYYPNKSGTNNLHLNDMGYAIFAQKVIDRISMLSDNEVYKLILN